jgi:hypothetical protein
MPPGSANPYQTCRHVHAVAEDVATIDDDVADIDPNAKLDPLLLRHVGVALHHATLNIKSTAHGVDHAAELGQHSIAGVLDNTAAVFGNLGIDEGAQMVLELDVRALFIQAG